MQDWLPPFAAAALLGVTVNHVHQLAHRRNWRRKRVGRAVMYWTDDVIAEPEGQHADTPGVDLQISAV